jgi:hypothetical protein
MHINEINGFAKKVGLDERFAGRNAKVVVILPKDGKKHYVARHGGTSENIADAFVYDYDHDGVAGQVEQVVAVMGVTPEVVEYVREFPAELD